MADSNFIDYVKIHCKSGNGGAGSAHFFRDKFNSKGGPDGGDMPAHDEVLEDAGRGAVGGVARWPPPARSLSARPTTRPSSNSA